MIVLYLFLGGTGAGVIVVSVISEVLVYRANPGLSGTFNHRCMRGFTKWMNRSIVIGLALLALGVMALTLDLGRDDRILLLLINPSPSVITIGTYAIVLFGLITLLYLACLFRWDRGTGVIVRTIRFVLVLVGLFVMGYTGVLLMTAQGIAFWNTPLIPLLFVLSSLSCGIAVMLITGLFIQEDPLVIRAYSRLVNVDTIIIITKMLLTALFLYMSWQSDHPGVVESVNRLTLTDWSLVWWFGFIVVGLIVPLVAEMYLKSQTGRLAVLCSIVGILILIGGFSFRLSIVASGGQRAPILEDVQVGSGSGFSLELGSEDEKPEE